MHHVNNPYNTRWDNIKLLLHHLSRSDYWSNRHFFTQLILLKADCRDRFNNLYYRRWGNKKLSLRQLPRSGCLSSSYLLPILSCSRYIVGIASTTYTIHVGGIRCSHYANYRVAVGPLVGQGWEPKRPTLPRLRREKTRP